MQKDEIGNELPTRRDCVKYGSTALTGGVLAGCTQSRKTRETPTETAAQDTSYSVGMEPVGQVTFESVPETLIGHSTSVEAAIAFGHADGIVQTVGKGGPYTGFYDRLPGVSFPDIDGMSGIRNDGALNKEYVYEIDPDLIGIDPNWLLTWASAEPSDIEELTRNVAPFFGSDNPEKRAEDWANWPHGEYRYYSIYELMEKWGQVFQQLERARALNELNRSLIQRIQSKLPPEEERPSIGLPNAYGFSEGEVLLYNPTTDIEVTNGKKHYRDLGVEDAFAGIYDGKARANVDYETMLEYDPDVIIFQFALVLQEEYQSTVEAIQEHPVASKLSAVQNDRVYPGGTTSFGPIINMFQTEMIAKELFPDRFGAFPGLGEPVPEDEQLFDRQRVAAIITRGDDGE
jgi:iron complex transport system substrate-binding protein